MKIRKILKDLLLYAAIGFGLGFIFAFLGDFLEYLGINSSLSNFADLFVEYILVLQVVIGGILAIIVFNYYSTVKKMISLEAREDSEEDEDLTEKIDLKQDKALTIVAVNYILSFTLFGLAIDDRNLWIIGSVIIFIALAVNNFLMEISLINQVKQRDPMKKGDPSESNFEEQWIESCDEAEKLIIYKAAYKSYTMMKGVLLFSMVVMLLSKPIFKTGNIPIILIGILWLTQTLSYIHYGTNLQKNKINI